MAEAIKFTIRLVDFEANLKSQSPKITDVEPEELTIVIHLASPLTPAEKTALSTFMKNRGFTRRLETTVTVTATEATL